MNLRQKIRRKFLYTVANALRFVPDKWMLTAQYFVWTKNWMHWENPQRFSEKMQYYKVFYRDSNMFPCTDKYLVRDYVKKRLGNDDILNTLYQVCDSAEEIDFEKLPAQFVIKTTDGGNGDNIVICKDKHSLNIEKTIKEVNSWRNKKYYIISREWAYKGDVKPRIVVEKYLCDSDNIEGQIDDYKFLCYHGKFRFLWLDKDRYTNHRRCYFDENLKFLKGCSDYPTMDVAPQLPANINEMIVIAQKLAEPFPFARVDLYNIGGKIIFGEITFYPASGYNTYKPDSFDFELGKYFDISKL
jgi:hypothetical protein